MASDIRFWCCPYFLREVQAVAAVSPHLAGLPINNYPFSCLQSSQQGQGKLTAMVAGTNCGQDVVIGGGCLSGWEAAGGCLSEATVLAPLQCFYLVAPSALVDHLIAEGAYLMTPGWLAEWRDHLTAWGFDQATARSFFQETTRSLVLLDTGLGDNRLSELAAMGAYLGLPHQAIPVGLDLLKLSLERAALELRQNDAGLAPPDHYFADQLMVIDIINDILTAQTEAEAVHRMEELFFLLFAPGRLNYIQAGTEPEENRPETGQDFAWTDSDRGFVVPLIQGDQYLGVIELDDLAFVEYKERYISLALPLAKVCALAIINARAAEARSKAEQALRRMAGIVASSDDAIIGKTLEGVIVSWNKGARRIYGYREAEVLGRHISFLTPPNQPDEMTRILETIRSGQTADQVETVWVAKDGRLVDVSLQVSPIRNDDDRVVGASSIARDITKEKQKVEQERRSLEAQLIQAQKLESVGRLAGGVAHDFNNMLAIILGYSELALLDIPPEAPTRANLEQIHGAAERAKGLTRQLLAFARKQVLQMSNLNLNGVITDFSKMLKRLIGEDIDIKLGLADNLPVIHADPAMMEQILLNLAVNARDAMPDGGALTIETSVVYLDQNYTSARFDVTPGDYVRLTVTDTGSGMTPETVQAIFEPFFTTKEQGKGTGLGLATVYGIVKQHGGNIWVYSELDQGTTFKIHIPVAEAGLALGGKPVPAQPAPAGGQTILLVEDDPILRIFINKALVKMGYQVLCAGSPSEAQKLAHEHTGTIHLMLTDVVMPEMNGRLLYESLAPLRPNMEVVFMSGYTENVIADRGVLEEGINFLQKPFSIPQLAAKLGSILTVADKDETV